MPWTSANNRTSTPQWKKLRRQAIHLFGNECAKCGADGNETRLELDHITPVSEGGDDHLDNTQLLCPRCHKPKTQAEATRGRARRSAKRRLPTHPADAL